MDCWYCHGDVEESGREMKKRRKKKKEKREKVVVSGK